LSKTTKTYLAFARYLENTYGEDEIDETDPQVKKFRKQLHSSSRSSKTNAARGIRIPGEKLADKSDWDKDIRMKYKNGFSVNQIARELRITPYLVNTRLGIMGIKLRSKGENRHIPAASPELLESLRRNILAGNSIYAMPDIDLSPSRIDAYIRGYKMIDMYHCMQNLKHIFLHVKDKAVMMEYENRKTCMLDMGITEAQYATLKSKGEIVTKWDWLEKNHIQPSTVWTDKEEQEKE